jgi:aspartyl protease
MFNSSWHALASLFLLVPVAFAEAHCPGKAASVHVRHVAGSLTVIPVEIDHTGPYDFLLDTGSEVTALDPRLASSLNLKAEGVAAINGVGSHAPAVYGHLALMEVGPHPIPTPLVFIKDIHALQAAAPAIRGVIGGDILRRFDVLLDQDKNLLCLDTDGIMQSSIRGERIPFATPPTGDGSGADTEPLIAEVHLSRLTARTLYLLIDSGANVPYLCDSSRGSAPSMGGRAIQIGGVKGPNQDFLVLPAQDVPIGRSILRRVSFVIATSHNTAKLQVDGMLPTGLFRSIYISYSGHFMVLEPW